MCFLKTIHLCFVMLSLSPFYSKCHNDSQSPLTTYQQCLHTFVCADIKQCADSHSPSLRNHRMYEVITGKVTDRKQYFSISPLLESAKVIPHIMNHRFIIKNPRCSNFNHQIIIKIFSSCRQTSNLLIFLKRSSLTKH